MDPLSLLGVGYSLVTADLARGEDSLIKKVSGKVIESAVYGSIEGYTYDKLKGIYANFRKGDSENLYHDLQRAARKAQLTATLLAVRACLAETERSNAHEKSLWSKAVGKIRKDEDEKWLNELAKLWQQKIDCLPKEVPPEIVERDQIISLFDPKLNLQPTDIQKQLVAKLKEDALAEIRAERYSVSPLPEAAYEFLEEAIYDGWNEFAEDTAAFTSLNLSKNLYQPEQKKALINPDKQYDWFSLVCGLFNEEYKTNKRVEAAMQKYLLLDIRDRQTGVQLDPKIVADLFAGHLAQFGESFARLEALLKTIDAKQDRVLDKQDEILVFVKNQFVDLARRIDEVKQTVIVESEKIQQQLAKGVSDLADLIRQDKALPPAEREAIQEGNRQDYQREIALEHAPSEVVGSFIERDRFFVDRDTERESLKNRLLAGEKMIVVKAFSGYGKTSLMTEVLHTIAPGEQLSHEKVRGILLFYCRDKEQASLREVCRKTDARLRKANVKSNFVQTYEAFKREARDNPNILPTGLIDKLIHDLSLLGDIWMVFDNFETALDGATVRDAELREFFVRALPMTNRLRFIVTSQKFPQFDGIDGVRTLPIGDLPESFAKEFLRKKGVELKADEIDCGLAEAGEAVLDTLLGETSAVPMRLVSFVGYLREAYLKQGRTLTDALADASVMDAFREHDAKKGSMSLLEKQYLVLNDTERLILKALSIFSRAVPFTVLKSVLPLTLDEDEILSCLMSSSLVRRAGSSYELLTLPKEVIVKQAESISEPYSRREMHTRAADFYASIRKPKEGWKTIEDLAPQFAEMYHSSQAGLYDRAANVLGKEASAFLRRAGYSRRVVEERKELAGKPMSEQSKAYNSGWLANAYSELGDQRTAIKYNNEALEAFHRLDDRRSEGIALGNIGIAYSDLGEKRKALKYYEQALLIHREVGDRVEEGKVLGNIGNAYLDLGETRKALGYYEQALQIHRRVSYRVGEGVALGNIGIAYSTLGENRKALEYYEQALQIHREVGNRVEEGRVLGNKGLAKFVLDEKEEGIRLVEQALEIARQVEDKMFEDIWLKKLEAMKGLGNDAP